MREIKFRAWDKENGCMVTWKRHLDSLDDTFLDDYYLIDIVNSAVVWNGDPNGLELRESPAIIEQFTGLHDSKGVEIYEGDVLGWAAVPELGEDGIIYNFSKESDVHWCEDAWAVFINEQAQEATLARVTSGIYNDCEVISNIHESEKSP